MHIPIRSEIHWRLCEKEKAPDCHELLVILENQDVWEGYLRGGVWFSADRQRFGLKVVGWAFQKDIIACKEKNEKAKV
jgi:hypothetical protein